MGEGSWRGELRVLEGEGEGRVKGAGI